MFHFYRPLTCCVLALFLPAVCAAALITNGGFETGSFSSWRRGGDTTYVSVCATGTAFYGLTCTSHTGTYAAALGNSTSNGTLTQTMATVAGAQYSLTFFLRSDNYSQAANNVFQVSWGGATIYSVANLADSNYMQVSFASLKATTNSTALVFTYKNVPGAFFLDDVSVIPASEPATLAIAGSGLITVWLIGVRRRRLVNQHPETPTSFNHTPRDAYPGEVFDAGDAPEHAGRIGCRNADHLHPARPS
jgi:hypothetical protein